MRILGLRIAILRKLFNLRYFSVNELDKQLEHYLDFDNGYFVELGANDGVNQSNTLFLEHFRGWKGVLIEPYPPNYEELVCNRKPTNYFKNTACVGPTYMHQTIELAYSNLMTTALGIKSDVLYPIEHANSGSKFWGGKSFIFKAHASTLNSVLIEANAPHVIDFLSLDVEGVELEILKGVDHSCFRFRYICVESRQLDELQQFLLSQNYSFLASLSAHDYLFEDSQTKTSSKVVEHGPHC
jgi:FkbM family methyltransferase